MISVIPPFVRARKHKVRIQKFKTKATFIYLNSRPIIVGLFTVLFMIAFGMTIVFATSFATPSQVFAQVVGPDVAYCPPPPPPTPTTTIPTTANNHSDCHLWLYRFFSDQLQLGRNDR